jgi:hypothetical protein
MPSADRIQACTDLTNGSKGKKMPNPITRVLVLTVGVLAAGVVAGAPQAVALTPVAASAGHVEASADPRPGCIGDSFTGTLRSGQAICNDNYLVRMQPNGDLVLREISTGRACWASQTRAPDAHALFNPETADLVIESLSRGFLRLLRGAIGFGVPEHNASVNAKGEFYVGHTRVAGC